jgi:hypothetical protein
MMTTLFPKESKSLDYMYDLVLEDPESLVTVKCLLHPQLCPLVQQGALEEGDLIKVSFIIYKDIYAYI